MITRINGGDSRGTDRLGRLIEKLHDGQNNSFSSSASTPFSAQV
jgi:hypothetical protein